MNPLVADTSLFFSQSNIMDESFRPENGADYFLSVLVNNNAVSWSAMDRKRNKVIALKSKNFDGEISSLKDDELIRGVSYRSVHIAEVNKYSTLIPAGLYEKGDEKKYLDLNSPSGTDAAFFTDR